MTNLDNLLQQLRAEHKQTELQVKKLNEAISVIAGLAKHSSGTSADGVRPRRTVSAATRKRMVQAQSARWAKAVKRPQLLSAGKASRAKRTLSVAARWKIAAAQRARWANVRALKKAA